MTWTAVTFKIGLDGASPPFDLGEELSGSSEHSSDKSRSSVTKVGAPDASVSARFGEAFWTMKGAGVVIGSDGGIRGWPEADVANGSEHCRPATNQDDAPVETWMEWRGIPSGYEGSITTDVTAELDS